MAPRGNPVLVLALLFASAGSALGQIATGNIYGTVADESGGVLPGVAVSLEGEVGTRTTVSGPQGEFRFLRVSSGHYSLSLVLDGFASLSRAIRVTTGEDVELAFTMKLSAIEETIEVLGETSLVTTRRRGTSTAMTAAELEQVPNARDPWAVLRAVPGVTVSGMNIAGNGNGQQDNYTGKGTQLDQSDWSLDGLVFTDMAAGGPSSYFEFEALDEISVSTGANDLVTQSGGVAINLTTKRGTNRFHGGARFLISHDDLSFGNLPDSLANDPRLENADGTRRDKADHIQQISDYGFELGGPIVRDRLWLYGSWGNQDIRIVRLTGTSDRTTLPGLNIKLNWQATPKTAVSGLWFRVAKETFGKTVGFWAVDEPDSYLRDQRNEYTPGGLPGGLWKLQVDHTISPNLFLSAKLAYNDNGYSVTPRGGMDQSYTIDLVRGLAIGSSPRFTSLRPKTVTALDGNWFFPGLGGENELKFGFSWRDYKATDGYELPGNGLVGYLVSERGGYAEVDRSSPMAYQGSYWSAYVGNVLTRSRFSLNLGVRWDWQRARNLPGEVAANPALPGVLPALVYPGDEGWPIDWSDWSPRLGLSYALDASRRTVCRASYAMYAKALHSSSVTRMNPMTWGWLGYPWRDVNGDRFVQAAEVDLDHLLYSGEVNLDDPSSGQSPHRIDSAYRPARDHEVVVGIDRELGTGFAVGAAYTWRATSRFEYAPWRASACPVVGANLATCRIVQPDEFTANEPETANGYTAFTYSPPADLLAAGQGGRILTNAPGYRRTYNGLELTLVRRLANRWMGRVAVSWNDWRETWQGSPYSVRAYAGNPTRTFQSPLMQGGQVTFVGTLGSTSNIRWQVYANGLVQLPWGLDASGALFARQGGAYPVSLTLPAGADGTIPALGAEQPDSLRHDSIFDLDLRLAKTIRVRGGVRLVLSAEWFNVLNSGTVLNRYFFANSPAFVAEDMGAVPGRGRIDEILSPSIFRIGARLAF